MTGAGSTIAIIDTGIDSDSPEFAGRIHPDSTDVAGNSTFEAVDDHGTNVALVAGAAFDGNGVVGIAFDASILALRADEPDSCTASEDDADLDGCVFFDRDIARGVDQAVASGATVINLSLGGSAPTQRLNDAIARAAAAGIVIVVAAGNDGDSTEAGIDPDNPDPFASGILAAGGSNVIIVGSVNDAREISDFSNRAGNGASSFLSARGERICCVYEDGTLQITTEANGDRFVTLFSGTSFAAPQVAGAVALLAQAFPNLTGTEIVEILLDSASDVGTAGVDSIFGRGILDIARALQPQGTTRVAGTSSVLALADDTGTGSGPMGDALVNVPIEIVILDKYDRAYSYNFGSRLRGASVLPRVRGAVERRGQRVVAGNDQVALAFTVDRDGAASGANPLRLNAVDAEQARVLAGQVALKVSGKTKLGFAFSQSADGIAAHLQGKKRPAFLIAGDAAGDTGFARSEDAALAIRQQVGPFGVTMKASNGEAWLGALRDGVDSTGRGRERYGLAQFGVALDRQFGRLNASIGADWLREDRTVLGAFLHDAFGANGADSYFLDASLGFDLASDVWVGANVRQGITRARQAGLVGTGSTFRSSAWSIDFVKGNTFQTSDTLGFRISQPLRVGSGGLNLSLPVSYDYATEAAVFDTRSISLSPEGRELLAEIAWRGYGFGGNLAISAFYRRDPGHYAGSPDDKGLVLRWNRGF
ncbi:S8 family peptidase [Parerythrobacter jejuensis]|uniref:S8 family peptidase n=1 Tax=Parerythrobacter jejuensis TaxID=795812 RepID=UPI002D806614|nr:S8 family peptidase [Parerythrobacter jejuensis]